MKTINYSERKAQIYERRGACRASDRSSMLEAHRMAKEADPDLLETFARQRKDYTGKNEK